MSQEELISRADTAAGSSDDLNAPVAWRGLPAFEAVSRDVKLVLSFDTVEERDQLIEQIGVHIAKKNKGSWSAWWPPRQMEDLVSLRFDFDAPEQGEPEPPPGDDDAVAADLDALGDWSEHEDHNLDEGTNGYWRCADCDVRLPPIEEEQTPERTPGSFQFEGDGGTDFTGMPEPSSSAVPFGGDGQDHPAPSVETVADAPGWDADETPDGSAAERQAAFVAEADEAGVDPHVLAAAKGYGQDIEDEDALAAGPGGATGGEVKRPDVPDLMARLEASITPVPPRASSAPKEPAPAETPREDPPEPETPDTAATAPVPAEPGAVIVYQDDAANNVRLFAHARCPKNDGKAEVWREPMMTDRIVPIEEGETAGCRGCAAVLPLRPFRGSPVRGEAS